jgi:2-methylcitrate dehydratase PrpD
VAAARLAARGARGPAAAIEGRFGLFHAFVGGARRDLDQALQDLGLRWEILRMAYKLYPACHLMHGVLGALAEVMGERRLKPHEVDDVVVTVPERAVPIVLEPQAAKQAPRTPYEGKFSLQFSVAAQLAHGRPGLDTYTAAAIADPEVLGLARRVRYEVRPYEEAAKAFPGGVRVRLADGRVLARDLLYQPGAPENPAAPGEVRAKFRDNAGLALPDDQVAALETHILGLEHHDDLTAVLAPLGRLSAAAAGALSG